MKKQKGFFLGIDVSKLQFDITLMAVINFQKQQMISEKFDNTIAGLKSLKNWLKEHKVAFDDSSPHETPEANL